jgi:hypothetical protein
MTQAKGYGPDHSFVLPDGRTGWWVARDPKNSDKLDSVGHVVKAREPRGWVNDSSGSTSKASHGHARKYYCVACMVQLDAPEVPRW